MSAAATRWAWAQQGLTAPRKLVLLALADRAGKDGSAWPSVTRLSADTGADERTVRASLSALEGLGLVSIERAQGRSSRYQLALPTPPKNEGTTPPKIAGGKQPLTPYKNEGTPPTKLGGPPPTKLGDESKRRTYQEPIGRFSPPTPAEVSAYGREIGFAIDGEKFVDYYASKGWVVGRSPMKDWKAAVRTWKRTQGGVPAAQGSRSIFA